MFHVDLPKDPTKHVIKLKLSKNAVMQLNSPIDIEMALVLTSLFPLEGPRLYILSKFGFPSLADGRDVAKEITSWEFNSTLYEFVIKIPSFIQNYIINGTINSFIGIFHFDEDKPINEWIKLPAKVDKFECREISNPQKMIIIIFETTILIFEVISKEDKISRLRIWCTIFAIKSIEKIDKAASHTLIITFLEPATNILISKVFCFTKIKKVEAFLRCYFKQLEKFKVLIDAKIFSNEVESQIGTKIGETNEIGEIGQFGKIEEIDNNILKLQEEIIKDKSKMNDLVELLRLAIEHYSSIYDDKYLEYLSLLQKLIKSSLPE